MKIYRLQEFKTNQLRKLYLNGNITEDQFNTADKFFKTYNAYEKEIDWNKGLDITWEDLEKVIKKERNSKSIAKKKIRKGLEGFKEGKDYLVIGEGSYNGESWVAYQPFTWEASRMIASHYVEPSRNRKGEIVDAGWCTSYQKNRTYWDKHNKIEAFIYLCGETIPTNKVAISISEEGEDASGSKFLYSLGNLNYNIWDFKDYNYTIEEDELLDVVPNLYGLIRKVYNNWENKMRASLLSGLKLNPDTNRYDYDGDIYEEKLRYFVAKNGDGFKINFGEVTGDFGCSKLQLISLKGAPQIVGGSFDCSFNHLTSLEGCPQTIRRDFNCAWNYLTSLKGASKEVGGNFYCVHNQLTSLEGAPQTVRGSFDCTRTHLTSLEGAPQIVGGSFDCSGNNLTSLEGSPQTVGRDFNCIHNQLTSLEGSPQTVKGDFDCCNNRLVSLEGAPQTVVGDFDCRRNDGLHSLDGIGKVKGTIYKDF